MVEFRVFEGEHCKCEFVESKVLEFKFVESILHSMQASSILVYLGKYGYFWAIFVAFVYYGSTGRDIDRLKI